MHVVAGILGGFVASMLAVVALLSVVRLPAEYIAVIQLGVWGWVSVVVSRYVKRRIRGRRLAGAYRGEVSHQAAYYIDQFEQGVVLSPEEIDRLVRYFRAAPSALAALRQQKPGVAAAIEQFFPESDQLGDAEANHTHERLMNRDSGGFAPTGHHEGIDDSTNDPADDSTASVRGPVPSSRQNSEAKRVTFSWLGLAIGAVALVAVSVGVTSMLTQSPGSPSTSTHRHSTSTSGSGASSIASWSTTEEVTATCGAAEAPAEAAWCFDLAESLDEEGCGVAVFREAIVASSDAADEYREVLFRAMGEDGCAEAVPEAMTYLRVDEYQRRYGGLRVFWQKIAESSDCAELSEWEERYSNEIQETDQRTQLFTTYTGYLQAIAHRASEIGC